MLKIAYCDDVKTDRDRVLSALSHIEEKWELNFDIYPFDSGESLCESITQNHYDIILLDILMNGIDGIETATRIRSMGEDNLIIFISSYDDRLKELFDFRTIAFIDKPIDAEKLEIPLKKAYNIIKKDKDNYFSYVKKGSIHYISINHIQYFESKRNSITIHTDNYSETYYDTLSSVWTKVEGMQQFIMPHRSFIFNLSYVTLKPDKIIMRKTNETFNIGDKYKIDTQDRYLKFFEKRCK